jgi:glycosyltransferase involved in cell wall biosynthesis
VHHADPSYLGVPVARLAGVPTIVQTKYDVGYWLTGTDRWLHRRMRRWVDFTVSNCQACREAAIDQEHAPPARVVVIDNGIDMTRLVQIDSLTAEDWNAGLRVGMVANLRPIKDPQNLLQAAQQLIRAGCQASFHFAGQGPLQEPLQAEIDKDQLQERIVLHGYVRDTATFISTLQIFVLCSRSEGLPHALLEAMAAGRAVIATDVGGNRELIQDQVNGLLIPPADPRALADAIQRLLGDPELALQLAQAARRSVANRFSLPAMTQRFTDFYRSLRQSTPLRDDSVESPTDGNAEPTTASLGELR